MTLEQILEIIERYKLRIPPTVYYELLADVREAEEEQEPTTKNDLGVDCISRTSALDSINWAYNLSDAYQKINDLPSVTPQEPQTFRWCTDCKEYDQERHCCHRWSKVIRNTVAEMKQEYIEREVLDKIKAKIEQSRYGLVNDGLDLALSIIDECIVESEET